MQYKSSIIFFIVVPSAVAVIFLVSSLRANEAPGIVITSPQPNSIVSAGQTIFVTIQPLPGTQLKTASAWILPFSGVPPTVQSPPYQVSLAVPTDRVGLLTLKAVAVDASNDSLQTSINLRVQNSSSLTKIQSSPMKLSLLQPGEMEKIVTSAVYSDGRVIDISANSDVQYSISNSKVISVQNNGTVVALLPGTSTVTVQYDGFQQTIPVAVGIFELKGDLNGDGAVDQNDLNIITSALNTPSTGPGDPRDLNNDGRIDALDSRILVTLCSRARCATQ